MGLKIRFIYSGKTLQRIITQQSFKSEKSSKNLSFSAQFEGPNSPCYLKTCKKEILILFFANANIRIYICQIERRIKKLAKTCKISLSYSHINFLPFGCLRAG